MIQTTTCTRAAVALLTALLVLSGCSPASGGGSGTTEPSTQGTDESNAADEGTEDDGTEDEDSSESDNGVINPCTLIPDAMLEAALGSAPAPDRAPQVGPSGPVCYIESTAGDSRLNLEISVSGGSGFEVQRSYKEPVEGLYQPLTGIGDDAFAFGSEVTVLVGEKYAVLFLEGLYFDTVPEADRLERTKILALEVAAQLD